MKTAAYARYSSDQQRPESIQDQLRNCRVYAERMGWSSPVAYSDAAISGSLAERPGYQRMLADAESRAWDVLLVDDLSRLSRDQVETTKTIRLLQYWGIRLIGVSDGLDTEQRGYKIHAGMRGMMSELYLDDLAEKTHRGLMGRALSGNSAGGLPYGYRRVDTGRREPDPEQARWVAWIFEHFANGWSPRRLAAELNKQNVPAPRGGKWSQTAIYGDSRGIGMLSNPIYIGQQIWNRSKWIKDPLTGKRKRRERPSAEWVITEHEDLCIVDQATWDAVKARQKETRARTQELQAIMGEQARSGRGPKYLLSGLLKCGLCAASYVVVDRYRYGCGMHKDRGRHACGNELRVSRTVAEKKLLGAIKRELLSEDAYQAFVHEVRALMKDSRPDPAEAKRELARAQREIDNLMAAIRQGIITPSTKSALEEAEAKAEAAKARVREIEEYQPELMLPRAREIYQGLVDRLENMGDIPAAREAIRGITGEIRLVPEAGILVAEMRADGLASACQISLVAGARYETYSPSLIRVPLTDAYDNPSR